MSACDTMRRVRGPLRPRRFAWTGGTDEQRRSHDDHTTITRRSTIRSSAVQVSPQPGQAARQLLLLLAAERPAPDSAATLVDTLAERLGLDVAHFHPAGRRTGTLGWLEPGERLIYVREGLSEASRRFTLAHEIGHAVLHRPGGAESLMARAPLAYTESYTEGGEQWPPECDGADLDTPLDSPWGEDELLRPGQAYSGRAQRESEANAFAAELL